MFYPHPCYAPCARQASKSPHHFLDSHKYLQNGILTSNSNRGARDFCLLLVVCIHCFCLPIFSFVTNVFCGFGAGIGNGRSERACFECRGNVTFKEAKDFLFKLFSLFRERVEYNSSTTNLYHEAVKR